MTTMLSLILLSTGFALAAIACIGAMAAARAARRAEDEANALRTMRGRVIALEHGLEGMESRVKRVLGAVYEARSHARAAAKSSVGPAEFAQDDDELDAFLTLQSSPPAKPQ